MNRMSVAACVLACAAAVLGGCAKNGMATAGDAKSDLFEPVSKLAGDWYMKDEKGQEHLVMQFRVTSGGTAVREIMFPGQGHEMTNMYHRDGGDLVVTHYCAAGNQPRMRARGLHDGKMEFKFDSITNKMTSDEEYMGEMTLNFTGPNTVVEEWWSYKAGKREEGPKFQLYRKGPARAAATNDLPVVTTMR